MDSQNMNEQLRLIAERVSSDHDYRDELKNNPDAVFDMLMGQSETEFKESLSKSLSSLETAIEDLLQDPQTKEILDQNMPNENTEDLELRLQDALKMLKNRPSS